MTVVINLLGGSGLGKSTTAALVYGEMKLKGADVELVREFVKEWAIQGRLIGPMDQGIIYGEQLSRETSLYDKSQYIVTDSPLILCPVYQQFYTGKSPIKETVLQDLQTAASKGVRHLNVVLGRNKPFNPKGRYETADQAKQVDAFLINFLKEHQIPFVEVTTDDRQRVIDIITLAEAI